MTETDPDAPAPVRVTGRPTLLTPDLANRIVQVVSAGNYLKTAAQFAGVGQSTLLSWLARGRAASAEVDAHPEGHVYCPACGEDRTTEVADLAEAEEREAARHEEQVAAYWEAAKDAPMGPPPTQAHAVMGRCPSCRTTMAPRPWTLPERELPYLEFLERVTQAETVAEVSAVTHWRRAFADDWRAARDYLARKRPDQWAAKSTVTLSSEEAEGRIERATMQALTALGVDTTGMGLEDLDAPDLDLGGDGEDLDG